MGSRIDNGDFDVVLKIIGSIASRLFCGLFYVIIYYRVLGRIKYIAVKKAVLIPVLTPVTVHKLMRVTSFHGTDIAVNDPSVATFVFIEE